MDVTRKLCRELIDDIEQKKQDVLAFILSECFGIKLDKESAKRLTRVRYEVNPEKEEWILDYNKSTQRLLMNWHLRWPHPREQLFIDGPIITVAAPISVKGIL